MLVASISGHLPLLGQGGGVHDAIVTAHVNLRRAHGAPLSEQQRVVSTSNSVLSSVFLQGRRVGGWVGGCTCCPVGSPACTSHAIPPGTITWSPAPSHFAGRRHHAHCGHKTGVLLHMAAQEIPLRWAWQQAALAGWGATRMTPPPQKNTHTKNGGTCFGEGAWRGVGGGRGRGRVLLRRALGAAGSEGAETHCALHRARQRMQRFSAMYSLSEGRQGRAENTLKWEAFVPASSPLPPT